MIDGVHLAEHVYVVALGIDGATAAPSAASTWIPQQDQKGDIRTEIAPRQRRVPPKVVVGARAAAQLQDVSPARGRARR